MSTMVYSEERGTWNLIDEEYNEWIFEGTYEQCEKMLEAEWAALAEEEDAYYCNNEYDY